MKKIEKVEKLVANLHGKTEYVIHIKNLKQALNHRLVLKNVHTVIKFNQNVWLKPYIDMNTDLRKKAKNDFEKDFFKLINNAVFRNSMENVRKHRDTQQKEEETICYQNQIIMLQIFSKKIKKNKTEKLINKSVYLGLLILELSKILMYELWYGYVKLKYGEKVRLCYMDTDSCIV